MSYLKFTLWLLSLYFVYYTLLVLWDLFKSRERGPGRQEQELTFAEPVSAIQPAFEPLPGDHSSAITASGGVSLRQMFNLAQDDAVEFTSQVAY